MVEGVGFAMGMERLVMALQSDPATAAADAPGVAVWLVSFGARALRENLKLMQALRFRGVHCGMDLAGRSMKAQMRAAHRAGAGRVIIRGDAELDQGTLQLKDMAAGSQQEVTLPELFSALGHG
jgi:histidyl-tRNA synthetase